MNLEANLHSLLSFAWTLTRPTNFNLLRKNIVFSYSQRISFFFLINWLFFVFLLLFYVIINFYKNYFIIIILLYFFSWKLFLFFHVPGCSGMFRNVPACSGMFRNVPCSGFYRRPIEKWSVTLARNVHKSQNHSMIRLVSSVDAPIL